MPPKERGLVAEARRYPLPPAVSVTVVVVSVPRTEVELRIPRGLYGGNPPGLIRYLGLQGEHIIGERWTVRRPANAPDMLMLRTLADEAGSGHQFDLLQNINPSAPALGEYETAQLEEARNRLVQRASSGSGGDLAALFRHIQQEVIVAPHEHLPAVVEAAYRGLGRITFEETADIALSNRSIHLLTVSQTIIARIRLPAILFRIEQDPDFVQRMAGKIAQLPPEEAAFATAMNVFSGYINMARYMGPLIGCASPRFWSFHGERSLALILFSLGMDINGIRAEPMEPLQLLPISGTGRLKPNALSVPQSGWTDAIVWWVERLNEMLTYLLDPTNFADSKGVYSPVEHEHWLMTFDQVFALTTSLGVAARDNVTQRVAMVDLLDAHADRLTGWALDLLCDVAHARKTCNYIRTCMSDSVAALLMPAAERAVEALREAQQSFFIMRQTQDTVVRLRLPDGTTQQMQPADAVARLLKIYRNATHGFGGMGARSSKEQRQLDASLLLHHDGELPGDLVLLPYLYLLSVFCNPERMRAKIATSVAKKN